MKLFTIKLGKYNKFIMAIAGFVAVVGFTTFDGEVSDAEAAAIVSAAITAGGVFGVRNRTLDEIQAKADKYAAKGKV